MSNKKPEKRKITMEDNSYEMDILDNGYNQGLEAMETFNKQALGSVEEIKQQLCGHCEYQISTGNCVVDGELCAKYGATLTKAQVIYNYYKERFGV